MKNLIKLALVVTAFSMAAGCATKKPVPQVQPEPTPVVVNKVEHKSQKCKGKHCVDKLGTKATHNKTK